MPELSVSRKNISKLFSEVEDKKFIVPEYQRPYKWDEEKCDVLWNDIITFYEETGKDSKKEYFLGTIVTCSTEDGHEIIDGQQRITSLLLLLRAFYAKLEKMKEDNEKTGLKNKIAPCIWVVDSLSGLPEDKKNIHISSRVATESDNDSLHKILELGTDDKDDKSLYRKNYAFFTGKCDELAEKEPIDWQYVVNTILTRCIILPIECDSIDSALTIFSTLNDRGMPLSDSDIFKAQIYKTKNGNDEKKDFTDNWISLSEAVSNAKIHLDEIFRYYAHIIRAKNSEKSKEIALRKFYADNNYAKLKEPNLMQELMDLATFWKSIRLADEKTENISDEARKYIHCLQFYPNEYWKLLVSVFYYTYKDSKEFKDQFTKFLKQITASMLVKFIQAPTVNAIKDLVYANCVNIHKKENLAFNISLGEDFTADIKKCNNARITTALLLLNMYLFDGQPLIKCALQVEHILPKKWQDTNYNGWNIMNAEVFLDKLGNKMMLESKVNIQAGNNYFGKKKNKYRSSNIVEAQKLSESHDNDWIIDNIQNREDEVAKRLELFFKENII